MEQREDVAETAMFEDVPFRVSDDYSGPIMTKYEVPWRRGSPTCFPGILRFEVRGGARYSNVDAMDWYVEGAD
jgi:hypothetical protein